MLRGIGNKVQAFINHKTFHPGNLQNLEKVWQAEQRDSEQKKRQKELLEQRNHEVQIEELRKALREKERQQPSFESSREDLVERSHANEAIESLHRRQKRRCVRSKCSSKRQKLDKQGTDTFKVKSLYEEDVFCNGHSAIWGSFYDRKESKWGYACCHGLVQSEKCRVTPVM